MFVGIVMGKEWDVVYIELVFEGFCVCMCGKYVNDRYYKWIVV